MNVSRPAFAFGLALIVWVYGFDSVSAAGPAEDEIGTEHRESYFGLTIYIQQAYIEHAEIEGRIADFQPSADWTGSGQLEIGLAYAKRWNLVELLWGIQAASVDFMDADHFVSTHETHVALWYRRPLDIAFSGRLRLAPGLGLGYSWAWANVGLDGNSSDDDPNAPVLTGSGPMYCAGAGLELRVYQKSPYSVHIGLDYRYRIDNDMKAEPKNDGAAFFPGGSEFDFSGHYIGIAMSLKKF